MSSISKRVILCLTLTLCFCAIFVSAQSPKDSLISATNLEPDLYFKPGEQINYDVQYQWGILKLTVAKVSFQVLQSEEQKAAGQYHFKSIGATLPRYDWMFRVRDTFQSCVQMPYFKPVHYSRNTHEGKYHVANSLRFQSPYILSQRQNTKDGKHTDRLPFSTAIFDLQTAVYVVRQLNFKHCPIARPFYLHIIIDGKPYVMPIQNLGIEKIKYRKRIYACYHLVTDVIEGSIFKAHQNIDIWLSADDRRIPIKVEAPILIGRVKAVLNAD